MRFLFLLLFLYSCSGDELLQRETLLEMARKADPSLEVLIPPSMDKPLVVCTDYKPACWAGYKIVIKRLEVTALFYENFEDAYKSAQRVNGYYLKNWVFDDVEGEPVLERFFEEEIKAVKIKDAKRPE